MNILPVFVVVPAAAAGKGHHVGHGRISSNNVYEARHPLPHRLKRRILGTLNAAQ